MIREIRRALEESQTDFAKKCGVDQPTVSRWENNKNPRQPKIKSAKKILKLTEKASVKINKKTNEVVKTSKKNGFRNIVLDDIYA